MCFSYKGHFDVQIQKIYIFPQNKLFVPQLKILNMEA